MSSARVLSGLAVLALVTYLSFLLQEFAARTQLNATLPLVQGVGSALHRDARLWPLPSGPAPSASISWSGSDAQAHAPDDGAERRDATRIAQVGRMMSLAIMVLATDPAY